MNLPTPFLIESGKPPLSYEDLLRSVNSLTFVRPFYQGRDLSSFYVNFIGALLAGQDVTVLDNDLSEEEVEKLVTKKTLLSVENLVSLDVGSVDSLINGLKHTPSKITLFTSGTTGQPKEIKHTVESFVRTSKIDKRFQDSIWALAYNPTHMAGLQVFFQAVLNRNSLVYIFNCPRHQAIELLQSSKASHISATPTYYKLLSPFDFTIESVKQLTIGGEKSSPDFHEKVLKAFPHAKIKNIYASTEAGKLFTSAGDVFKIEDHLQEKVRIVEGELVLHRSLVGEAKSVSGEWYKTGDLVEIVSNEPLAFRFKSRKNEMINIGGYNVNPLEIEEVVNTYPGVINSRVYSKSNSVLGGFLIAEVEATKEISESEVRTFLAGKLQPFKIPRLIKFVQKIETTKTGKLKRQ